MSRCQHCNKLTHSEDLNVYFDIKDHDKIEELMDLENWQSAWKYSFGEINPLEIGKLKCGDVIIHFFANAG